MFNGNLPAQELNELLLVARRKALHHAVEPQECVSDDLLVRYDALPVADDQVLERSGGDAPHRTLSGTTILGHVRAGVVEIRVPIWIHLAAALSTGTTGA